MKTKFFLILGLINYIFSFGQVQLPPSAGSAFINNIHIGDGAGASETGSNNNVFVGYQTGNNNTNGYSNVFSGYQAGYNNTEGNGNVSIGALAGYSSTIQHGNTYIGNISGHQNSNGEYNSFLGNNSGTNSQGSSNVFIGLRSGYSSTGNNNVCIGSWCGTLAGNNNILIGNEAGNSEAGDQKLYIDNTGTSNPLIYGDFNLNELKFNATKVGIGPAFGSFPTLTFSNQENYRLFVRGGILAEEVRIRLQSDWADYVFSKDYKLLSLKDTEKYIIQNGHLPNMPSASQVKEEGIEMGNIVTLQQEKIEELTLHLIRQEKEMQQLKDQVQLLLKKE